MSAPIPLYIGANERDDPCDLCMADGARPQQADYIGWWQTKMCGWHWARYVVAHWLAYRQVVAGHERIVPSAPPGGPEASDHDEAI